jgi:hypothetical protein
MLTILGHKENASRNNIERLKEIKTTFRFHYSQNSYHQEHNSKCWPGCRGKRIPYILLMEISTPSMESCIEISQKTKNRSTI